MPSLAELIRSVTPQPTTLDPKQLDQIYNAFTTPEHARDALRVTRGEVEGSPHPLFAGMAPAELAQVDRYIDARTMNPLAGAVNALVAAPAYEAYKSGVQAGVPGLSSLNSLLASSSSPHINQYAVDQTSSPASGSNLTAAALGAWDAGGESLARLVDLVKKRKP